MNRFDIVFARRDWICSTMENLRCLNIALKKLIRQMIAARNILTVCSDHVTSTFWSECTLCSFLNIKELLATNRRDIWSLSNCSRSQFHNHSFHEGTPNHLVPLEHKIDLPFSCKRWTSTKIIRLELSQKLWLYSNKKT